MLRDPSLIPLSRQHQHALALCVRIDRTGAISESGLAAWQAEIAQAFEQEIKFHFTAEEECVFPIADRFPELESLTRELRNEHSLLRDAFSTAQAGGLNAPALRDFTENMSAHIRKEERILFEGLQQKLSSEELAAMGIALEKALAGAAQACALPNAVIKSAAEQKG